MISTTKISLVRHGHVDNPRDIIYGRLPGFPLSEMGWRQVQTTADALRNASLAAVFSSPMERAQQTATCLLQYHPYLSVITVEAINEIRVFFEGHPAAEVAARNWDMYTGIDPVYEQPGDIAGRVLAFIAELRQTYAGQHVALVSHGDVLAFTLLQVMGELPTPAGKRTMERIGVMDRYPATGSITTLSYRTDHEDEVPVLDYVRPYGAELELPALS